MHGWCWFPRHVTSDVSPVPAGALSLRYAYFGIGGWCYHAAISLKAKGKGSGTLESCLIQGGYTFSI